MANESAFTAKCRHVKDENGQILFHEYKKVKQATLSIKHEHKLKI